MGEYFVCDWWFNVDCSQAEDFYFLNEEIAAEREANSPGGAQDSYGVPQGRPQGSGGDSRNSGSRGSSGSASNINNVYSAPSGFSADSGYGAPEQTYAGVQPARRRTGKRGGKRFG